MILLQNPTLPNPTDPVEIDRAIQDLQMKLSNSLVWLTQSYPRAYPQIESTQKNPFVFPAVYLGKANNDYKYLNAAPDNDKKAQCFFLVDTEVVQDFVRGEHNILSYKLSIIFTANLKLVNDATLTTEIFQANLIQQVREVLTREITLTPYDLRINEVKLLFRDVYKEFQLQNAAVLEKAPFTHFRFECDLILQEECDTPILNRCEAIKSHLTENDLLGCILPTYNFAETATQNALSAQQMLDLKNWLLPQYDFGDVYWQNLLTAQQEIDLTFYLLPLVDFTDPLIQAIVTTQQKTDILNWLFPLLDFSQPSTQALVTSQQQIDLSIWLCGGVTVEKSTRFDGINEQYTASQSTSIEIERTDLFTMDCWVYPEILGVRQGIASKFNTVTVGRGWDFQILADDTVSFRLSSDSVAGNIITCTTTTTLPLNTWTHVLVTYLGNSVGSGMKIYFNAVEQPVTQIGTLTGTTIGGAAKIFRIGASIDGVTPIFYFKGYLYNFRLAKGVVLAPAETVTAYQIPLQPYPQLANLSFACKLGTKGYFGTTTWVLEDYAGGVSGVQGINVDLVDITTFLPPNT